MLLQQAPFLSISFSNLCGALVTPAVRPAHWSLARCIDLEMESV